MRSGTNWWEKRDTCGLQEKGDLLPTREGARRPFSGLRGGEALYRLGGKAMGWKEKGNSPLVKEGGRRGGVRRGKEKRDF